MNDLFSLVDWSRAQFALTAIYHWLFVPLTLGLGVIVGIMETIYYRTGDERWKTITKYWMTLFGVNFAIGVATGIILEFQFGTNWSNYSWFVGDIFGAPLAIEGIMAFLWKRLSSQSCFRLEQSQQKIPFGLYMAHGNRRYHIGSLDIGGQFMDAIPCGYEIRPGNCTKRYGRFLGTGTLTRRCQQIFHAVSSGWVLGGIFVVGVSAWYLIKTGRIS